MILAALAALVGAAVQSATGFGFALIVSPALFAVYEPYEAVTAALLLGLVLNVLVLFDGARLGPVRWRMLRPLLAAAIPGLGLGVLALELLSKEVLQVAVGGVVLTAASARLRRLAGTRGDTPRTGGPPAAVAGLVSGALTTSMSVSGPTLVLWFEGRGLTPAELRASLAATFLALNVAGSGLLLSTGGIDQMASAGLVLPLLGIVLVGHLVGALVFRRIDPEGFTRVVLTLVAVAGAASLLAGLAALAQ